VERLDLVLHQRDERRDDDGEVVREQRGKLVAERLARARRHHDERVATRERGLARLALAASEAGESEVLAQGGVEVHGPATVASGPAGSGGPSHARNGRSGVFASGRYARTTASSSSANLPFASSVPVSG
jgi:hypothetical protein